MHLNCLASGAVCVASLWALNIICILFPAVHMVLRLAFPTSAQEIWKDSRLLFCVVGMGDTGIAGDWQEFAVCLLLPCCSDSPQGFGLVWFSL